ncbi:MAG: PfkB family carbohydrate kinase [Candidatus Jordarchaeum sp.]|uniref:PfkB family carbohydrate kinase n=1 Tax=Candidatus Jordarchaeum sp. TaxID=2823881 RepID=UPI004049C9C2
MPKKEKVAISGSAAFDVIAFTEATLDEVFLKAINNKEEDARISFSFLVNKKVSFGGTALNIAYNMKLTNGNPLPISCVGRDFISRNYKKHLENLDIDLGGLMVNDGEDTAEAYIVTSKIGDQMSIFHTGALQDTCNIKIGEIIKNKNVEMGIISPNPINTMLRHSDEFKKLNVPFIADPGQMINNFTPEELLEFISRASMLIVNDYEAGLIEKTLQKKLKNLISSTIITRGAYGCSVCIDNNHVHIPAVKISKLVDPTGAGDAFRGGLLSGLSKINPKLEDLTIQELQTACQMGAVCGGYAVEQAGTQNHIFTIEEFKARYEKNYGKIDEQLIY